MEHGGIFIKLSMIEDVSEFVAICYRQKAEIDVYQKRTIIDGKSFLGLCSLSLSEPICVEINTDQEEIKEEFYGLIRKWAA